jgi:hypothetical protein
MPLHRFNSPVGAIPRVSQGAVALVSVAAHDAHRDNQRKDCDDEECERQSFQVAAASKRSGDADRCIGSGGRQREARSGVTDAPMPGRGPTSVQRE